MEQALTAVCKDIRLGKILIQTNHDTGEPEVGRSVCAGREILEKAKGRSSMVTWLLPLSPPPQLHYLRLPKEISEDYVILMDSTVSTGAAAMMAVRVLLVSGQPRGVRASKTGGCRGWGWGCFAALLPPGSRSCAYG